MVEEISPEALKERLDRGEDVQVVDIRQPEAYERGHIPGAENVPFDRLAREVEAHDWGDDIVVACPIGESSLQAARLLEAYEGVSADATVANLEGGYRAWDYELEAGPAAVEE
ncbi:MAG: rhodanese-like domain-containing protein [Halobacteriales archaeon]